MCMHALYHSSKGQSILSKQAKPFASGTRYSMDAHSKNTETCTHIFLHAP